MFPDDKGAPIELPYEDGKFAFTGEHRELVGALRRAALARREVQFAPYCRVEHICGECIRFRDVNAKLSHEVYAQRIVGADGRSSHVRKGLGFAGVSRHLSFMCGVVLRDVVLPCEGYGHVFVGPPGPVLMYRIGPRSVRVTMDVPRASAALRRDMSRLADTITPWIPPSLAPALRKTLLADGVVWMGTQFRPRCDYGIEPVALVGDAVGHFHPLTAAGMTMGLLDVDRLTRTDSIREYQRQREAESYVPELLSNALYELFTLSDPAAGAMRRAVYRSWRESRQQRQRLMRMLTGADTSRTNFARALVEIGLQAAREMAADSMRKAAIGPLASNLRLLAGWGRWPVAGVLPAGHRGALRASHWPSMASAEESHP